MNSSIEKYKKVECKAFYNAKIDERTCLARIKQLVKKIERNNQQYNMIKSIEKCKTCKTGKQLIKKLKIEIPEKKVHRCKECGKLESKTVTFYVDKYLGTKKYICKSCSSKRSHEDYESKMIKEFFL